MTEVRHNPALVPPGALGPTAPVQPTAPAHKPAAPLNGPAFADVLREKTHGVEFSKHALQRVERRGIDLNAPTMQRLEGGIERAAQKGARDAVIFIDGTAFVTSVKNKTVITAVDQEHMKQHVFTNIDSAVIA